MRRRRRFRTPGSHHAIRGIEAEAPPFVPVLAHVILTKFVVAGAPLPRLRCAPPRVRPRRRRRRRLRRGRTPAAREAARRRRRRRRCGCRCVDSDFRSSIATCYPFDRVEGPAYNRTSITTCFPPSFAAGGGGAGAAGRQAGAGACDARAHRVAHVRGAAPEHARFAFRFRI